MQDAQAASHQSNIKFLDSTFIGETPDTGHCQWVLNLKEFTT